MKKRKKFFVKNGEKNGIILDKKKKKIKLNYKKRKMARKTVSFSYKAGKNMEKIMKIFLKKIHNLIKNGEEIGIFF